MKTTLLLHWWWGSSNNNWFPWLKKEIEFKVPEIYVPNLPGTDNPAYEKQIEYLWVYSGDFKEWWNIIWHSLWCKLALKFVEEYEIINSTLILVAATYPWLSLELWKELLWKSYDNLEDYFDKELDIAKLNKLNNKIIVFLSDNDPFINMESAKKYYSKFENIEFIEFKGKWHFNEWSWTFELEEILEYLI